MRKAHTFRTLISRGLVFLVCVILLDQGLGAILGHLYFGAPNKMTYSLEGTNQDLLVFGSSRANRHYDCAVLEAVLDMSCFNNGLDGRNVYFYYILLNETLHRYTPRCVVLDVTNSDVHRTARDRDTGRLSDVFPYCDRSDRIRNTIVELRGEHERVFLYSKCYVYNSKLLGVAQRKLLGNDPQFGKQGFRPLSGELGAVAHRADRAAEPETDMRKVAYLERFMGLCAEKGIPLVVVRSPALVAADMERVATLCEENRVPFWDYVGDERFCQPRLFRDVRHMNGRGAALFSEDIAKRIKASGMLRAE